jgi:proteic killer suppression protein
MIKTFKDKETEYLWVKTYSKKIPFEIQKRSLIKLSMINRSKRLDDLKIPPSNHLEYLKGDRLGYYSIRINNKYRICFKWVDNDAYDVEIVDYH